MVRRRSNRRGVVLLIVLSLMVLFMLLVVTLIVTAGQYRSAALATARIRRTEDDGRRLAETAIYQLLRDVDPTFQSSLRDHGLLTDFYGQDGVAAIVEAASHDGSVDNSLMVVYIRSESSAKPLSRTDDYYNGRIVTFVSGVMAGYSTRVMDYYLHFGADQKWGSPNVDDDSNGTTDDKREFQLGTHDDVIVLVVDVAETDRNTITTANRPGVGDRLVINGAPFNGTGFGYDKYTNGTNSNVWLPGPDGAWGVAGVNDNASATDTVTDDISEAGTPSSDDVLIGNADDGWAAMFSHKSSPAQLGFVGTHAIKTSSSASGLTAITISDGGADESWDAVDFQNMYLAMIPPEGTFPGMISPSFHRPDLIRFAFSYLYNNTSNSIANLSNAPTSGAGKLANAWAAFVRPDLAAFLSADERRNLIDFKRTFIFRPLPEDNPNFNGSNSLFHYFGSPGWIDNLDDSETAANEVARIGFGQYDVDNDGDGTPDSIWVNIGLPVQTGKDGRRFRPLVAILCTDLDGRLNLNAHGSLESHPTTLQNSYRYHVGPDGQWGRANVDDDGDSVTDNATEAGWLNSDDVQIAAVASAYSLPRGVGFGPAEITLSPLFTSQLTQLTDLLEERHRDQLVGGTSPGVADGLDDTRSYYKSFLVPPSFGASQGRGYGTPPDVTGLGAIMLDHAGQPRTVHMGRSNETVDDPYEQLLDVMTAGGSGSRLQPFFISDFELLLRPFDSDASRLPRRLPSTSQRVAAVRNYLTVHSSHVPVANAGLPTFLRTDAASYDQSITPSGVSGGLGLYGHSPATSPSILDLFRVRLRQDGITTLEVLEREMRKIVPFEFRRGQMLDLNRPFGNGLDDNSNGAVDDFAETQEIWSSLAASDVFADVVYEGRNDDPLGMPSRIVLARHLYCLMMLLTDEDNTSLPTPWGPTLTATERATRIAQWAINVVDFRDPDGIMTPFEFDLNPFNGWAMDGNPGTNEGTDGVDNDQDGSIDEADEAERAVVWGCEYPDLIIKENVAFHDRRVKDTTQDNAAGLPADMEDDAPLSRTANASGDNDRDLDQYRIPEGSLFVELQCMRSGISNNTVFPKELYTYDAGNTNAYLDLGRMSPERSGVRYPVWRLAVGPAVPLASTNSALSIAFEVDPANSSIPAIDSESTAFRVASTEIERVIWFAPSTKSNFNASAHNSIGFYGRTGALKADPGATLPRESDVAVYPGQYAVIGPRATTYIGSAVDSTNPTQFTNSTQLLSLSPTFSATGTKTPANALVSYPVLNTNAANGIICAADPPASWTNQTRTVGLNVSEPMPQSASYYREPLPASASNIPDGYFDTSKPVDIDPMSPDYNAFPDTPFDEDSTIPGVLGADDVQTGTITDFKGLYLQRLADPTLPWNPDPADDAANYVATLAVNPYITVDWSRVDLTVFSGEQRTDVMVDTDGDMMSDAWIDPNDEDPYSADSMVSPPEQFAARARNGSETNVWSPRTRDPMDTGPEEFPTGTNPRPYFRHRLRHTLGYLNDTYGSPTTITPFVGIPSTPIPWLTWLNRPFASPYEVLLVPASSPDRLLYETISSGLVSDLDNTDDAPSGSNFTEHPFWPNLTGVDIYSVPPTGNGNDFRGPFAQLLNFFHSSNLATDVDPTTDTAAHFYRIFDYVEVPSPFVGTEKWLDPRAFRTRTTTNMMGQTIITNPIAAEFRPPFNKISRLRDPGRININTAPIAYSFGPDGQPGVAGVDDDGNGIVDGTDTNSDGIKETPDLLELFWQSSDDVYSGQIWEAIVKNYPFMDPTVRWLPGPDGRWGVAGTDDNMANGIDDSSEAGTTGSDDVRGHMTLVHLIRSLQGRLPTDKSRDFPTVIANPFRSAASADLMPDIPGMRRSGIDVSLLRRIPGSSPSVPLFAANLTQFDSNTANANLAVDRNPYFYYQGLTRLGNLLTTHSNVFAVWITVGFFEVEDNRLTTGGAVVFDPAHPDGLRLGQELGSETGDVNRHRSFFIIDRSIPVGFERGQNHNVDRTILLRRILE